MKKLLAAVTLLAVSTAQAATIHVDAANCPGPGNGSEAEPYCSIQTAIDNAMGGVDEVVVAAGTYLESINFLGKAITVRSTDGPAVTTINADGIPLGSVVTCASGEGPGTVLEGFEITGGNGTPTDETDCCFAHGTPGCDDPDCEATVCEIDPFCCDHTWDDICADEAPDLCDLDCDGPWGGGMYNFQSSPMVTDCIFSGNFADDGGGMYNRQGSPTVTNCIFSGNFADNDGGGMYNGVADATITNCTFAANNAYRGGGMFNGAASVTVTNCAFVGNWVSGGLSSGGGMHNNTTTLVMTGCTFSGNSAADGFNGGGMYNNSTNSVANCILWDNNPDEINDAGGAVSIVDYSNVQGGWPGTGNIDADPMFGNPDSGYYRLQPGSPCIDSGDNTAVPAGITTDRDGNPRFVDDPDTPDHGFGDPPIVDMGAYEFQGATTCPWNCGGDGNGDVGIVDFLALLAQWGGPGPCDFDGGGVGITDFLELLANWGPCP